MYNIILAISSISHHKIFNYLLTIKSPTYFTSKTQKSTRKKHSVNIKRINILSISVSLRPISILQTLMGGYPELTHLGPSDI